MAPLTARLVPLPQNQASARPRRSYEAPMDVGAHHSSCAPRISFARSEKFGIGSEKNGNAFGSTADAIVVIDVPVVDKKGWAMRREADDRVAAVGRRNRAVIDHGYDSGVKQRQCATGSQHFAPPVQREPIPATSQELIISARGVDPQNVAAHVIL